MRVAKNNSHIALLQFAYCRLSFRILLIFYRNVFLPHPEGAVGPILNSAFHEKDLQANNNDNFLFGKTSLYDNSKQANALLLLCYLCLPFYPLLYVTVFAML